MAEKRMSKILIAEDDPLTGRIYSDLLAKAGFEVELFANGLDFMARLPEARPEALLLDMMLPGISGIEIIRRVRGTSFGKDLPIVALTNVFVPAMLAAAQEAGANAIYDKAALSPTQLVENFKGLLGALSAPPAALSAARPDYEVSEGGWATLRSFRGPMPK
jgi:CheY-like chemotaxis protein